MSLDRRWQEVADTVGLIVDRTAVPEEVLGYACLFSKGRVACCATSVFNYTEAPWALLVRFPHPDLVFSVRSITLHPEFNKRDARMQYLNRGGSTYNPPLVIDNDLATLILEPDLPALQPERVAELNSALSFRLSVSREDMSGTLRAGELSTIIQRACSSNREGALTIYDGRNRVLAWMGVRQGLKGYVNKIIYKGLINELALFELIYRQPSGAYVFQSPSNFTWPSMPDVGSPPDKLVPEGVRRAQELPSLIQTLGGPEARYERAAQQYDPNVISQDSLWIVQRLWPTLDGFITLDQLYERLGVDTFSITWALQELVDRQLVKRKLGSPFHCSGQLGMPFSPEQELSLNAGDALVGAYLDALTGRPLFSQGTYFGVKHALTPKVLLHTVPIPATVPGAVVLKDTQLIGLHNGPLQQRPGEPVPPTKLYQMTWFGAVNDLSPKRLRASMEMSAVSSLEPPAAEAAQDVMAEQATSPRIGRYICPNCASVNAASGFCKRCGTDLETGEMPGASDKGHLRELLKPAMFTRKQMIIAGVGLLTLASLFMMFGGHGSQAPAPAPAPPAPAPAAPAGGSQTGGATSGDVVKAIQTASQFAAFKDTPPDTYVYEDTSALTGSQPSFGLTSERQNQKLLFLVWDATTPVDNLDIITHKVPGANLQTVEAVQQVGQGQTLVSGSPFNYIVGRYNRVSDGKEVEALIGAFRSPVADKAIVLVAQPQTGEGHLDYRTTLYVLDSMANVPAAQAKQPAAEAGKPAPGEPKPQATPEAIEAYRAEIGALLKGRYHAPKDVDKQLKSSALLAVDEEGKISKVEVTKSSGDDSFDSLLVKLLSGTHFPAAPHTSEGMIEMKVTIGGGKLELESP